MQERVLIRARGLAAFRRALVDACLGGPPLEARRRVVLVPTRAAGELLRQTLEHAAAEAGRSAAVLPDVLTREDWIDRLHAALPDAPPLLGRMEREVLIDGAARRTTRRAGIGEAPFPLRPGLVAAMLDFYDELKRRQRSIRRFAHVLFRQLGVERGTDRGSEGLIRQTCFLAFTYLAYERALDAGAGLDEHRLRARLITAQPPLGLDHLVVAVADHPADPTGLWPADFDLIGRLHLLPRVEVVMTDEAHDAGFRDRLERELPGIVERRAADVLRHPRLAAPAGSDRPIFLARDREDELRSVARAIRGAAGEDHALRERTAIVFHRPLPYLYLAQQILSDAGVPYQAFDALPLAAEPYAALLDVTMAFARTGGAREAAIALLRATLLEFEADGAAVRPGDVAALDAVLAERRAAGGARTFPDEVEAFARLGRGRRHLDRARRAAHAAAAAAAELDGYQSAESASAQVSTLAGFLRRHERQPAPRDDRGERHRRARAAVLGVLDGLADAFARLGDEPRPHDDLSALIHHALEARTFAPRRGRGGVHLADASAARFGEFDRVHLVGLVDTDWPERPRRTVFYTAGLLAGLGWPQAAEVTEARKAAFRDVITLAAGETRLWAFRFEGDTAAAVSPLVEFARGLPVEPLQPERARPLFPDELLTGAVLPAGLPEPQARWLASRRSRPPLTARDYAGFVAPRPRPPVAYKVSAVDRFLDCPFKYFAGSVLGLEEERAEMAGLTPLERGSLLHSLFERFYAAWQEAGHGAITVESMTEALRLFERLAEETLEALPPADRALERARLLGSVIVRGVAERVFELEVNAGQRVVRRLLERDLNGRFAFPHLHGLAETTIEIRGKADRIDVLGDGALRVIDYKLGRQPERWSVQVGVYAHCASQALAGETGRAHPVSAAMYLAFGDDRRLEAALGGREEPVEIAVLTKASAFAEAVRRIEAGEFPPRPARPAECQWCGYSGVCRKEYRIEDDEAADAV